MTALAVEAKHHVYHLRDRTEVPSVTTVIGQNCGWDKAVLISWTMKMERAGLDSLKFAKQARSTGEAAHRLIAAYNKALPLPDLSKLPQYTQDGAYVSLDAYQKWEEEHGLKVIAAEMPLVSEQHHVGGTPDLICWLDDLLSLVELKTSNGLRVYPEHLLQVAAYRQLYREVSGTWLVPIMVVIDKETGMVSHRRPTEERLEAAWEAFLHCLGLHRLREAVDGQHPHLAFR